MLVVNASIDGMSMSRLVDNLENRDLDTLRSVNRMLRPCTHASIESLKNVSDLVVTGFLVY